MKDLKQFFIIYNAEILLVIVAFLLVAELFWQPAQPQTFDEWSHLLTENAFLIALTQGSFPVSWVDSVSNYGLPLGQIAHQTTSYLGAALLSLTQNSLLAYDLTLLIGSLLGTFLYYRFLRIYFSPLASITAAILFTFAPYRILNIYIRGAMPEFFTSGFIPLLLIGIHHLVIRRSVTGIWLIILAAVLLALSHPMMLVIGLSVAVFYFGYCLFRLQHWQQRFRYFFVFIGALTIGVLLASYYLLPLLVEIKYFYHGSIAISNPTYEFLQPNQFLVERWSYSYPNSPGVRESRPQLGSVELAVLLLGAAVLIWKSLTKRKTSVMMYWWLAAGITYVFLLLPTSLFAYKAFFILSGLQFPWRFLTSLVLIPPLFLAFLIDQLPEKKAALVVIICLIAVLRFPQLYGKNYVQFPETRYQSAIVNPHGTDMNTIWSGPSYAYFPTSQKAEIIEGEGIISDLQVTPTRRIFSINAQTPVRISDNTFYFPGWRLFVDGKEIPIEFQDQNYRGVITYRLPAGDQKVDLVYQNTKIRLVGKLVSVLTLMGIVGSFLFLKKYKQLTDRLVTFWLPNNL